VVFEAVIAGITASPTPRPTPSATSDSSNTLSVLALVVSVISLGTTTVIGYLQYRSQARLTAIEQGRRADEVSLKNEEERRAGSARVTVQWQQAPLALIVHNHGPALASDVQVEVSSAAPDHPPPGFQTPGQFPLKVLRPGEPYTVLMRFPYGMAPTITAELRWHDSIGPHHETVSLSAAS
jgi:hypothetical protein